MIGQTKLPRWRCDFDCRKCSHVKHIKDDVRDGMYCMPAVLGKDHIHADDDRVVRCDYYREEVRE